MRPGKSRRAACRRRLRGSRISVAVSGWAILCLAPLCGAQPFLSLSDAVREAVEKSPEVARALIAARQAGLQEPLLLAETDPDFFGLMNWKKDESPRAAPVVQGEESRESVFDLGITQRTLLGTTARLAWTNNRLSSPSAFRPLDPTVDSRLTLSVDQPLLRYFWGRPDKARRGLYRAATRAAESQAATAVENTVLAAGKAYVTYYFAHENLNVALDSRASSKKLLDVYQDRTRYGLADSSDLAQAEASLEVDEAEVLLSTSLLERARLSLLAVLHRQGESSAGEVAVSTPTLDLVLPTSEPDAVALGLNSRPDLEAARARLEAAQWNERVGILDTLPELSFLGSYGMAGLDTGYSPAWKDLSQWDNPVVSAGLAFRVPFAGRKEKLERKSGALTLEDARQELARVTEAALRDIRDQMEARRLALERVSVRRRIVAIERKKLEAERANFRRGRSSTDLLVRFQKDLQRAQTLALLAEADELMTQVELARATGGLARAWGTTRD
ncbi:MAG: TolC family protein [Elusimicrobia bacterium]|nr:TolC family protein [Elusimicrobiota bacterium]